MTELFIIMAIYINICLFITQKINRSNVTYVTALLLREQRWRNMYESILAKHLLNVIFAIENSLPDSV